MAMLHDGRLVVGGEVVLEGVRPEVRIVDDPLGNGVFLEVTAEKPAARLQTALGKPGIKRFTACHRNEPFWMVPKAGTTVAEVPVETQSLLVELEGGRCALLVPIVDGSMRCALEGNAAGELVLVAESNDPAVTANRVVGVYVAAGEDPYALCAAGARSVAARMGAGRLRRDKNLPAFVDQFGWCTWDAFYQEVSQEKVREGLASFAAGGVLPRMMILDDGWQSVRKIDDWHGTRLTAFAANEKFPGDLRPTVDMAKGEFGVQTFLVWHAFQGYWGGVDGEKLPGYGVRYVARDFGPGILHHYPQANEKWWGAIGGVVSVEHIYRFYQDYHRHLRTQGVDGVKVDNQGTQEGLAAGQGGRVAMMRAYHEALEGSVQVQFGGNLINCMSCSNDMLYSTLASTVTRTSTDFWPRRPETHGLHLYTNAHVGVWFGEFVHPDWDMFQSGHAMGGFHAAGRAVSGSPVYVSDKPGTQNFTLLRTLVCADGSVLRCDGPGVPTRDCLFADPTREDVLLKIRNTTRQGAASVVGLFNARYHAAEGERRTITGSVSPGDVPTVKGERFAVLLYRAGTVLEVAASAAVSVTLGEGGWEVATMVPVVDGIAVIGLADKLNSGAGVREERRDACMLEVATRDGGELVVWCARRPATVRVEGKDGKFTWADHVLRIHLSRPGTVAITW